ncbi:hypothetical protein IB227_14405 [Stenotrophomonas sp. STM01]|uniref:hypothetical protein n=1 Tax=Stenotrophomonas sp. STM01 TaxID=2769278 RepID=UPI001782AAB3|nr:hypothetical protein [Stenotrophomonas sp. STM01]MBD9537052.1 hypothetical protein [Stenotrophomonas sp. STM01]
MKSWQGRGLSGTVAAHPLNRLREQQLRGRQNRDTVSAMSSFLATAVNNNRNNLRANNRARPMRDCDQS